MLYTSGGRVSSLRVPSSAPRARQSARQARLTIPSLAKIFKKELTAKAVAVLAPPGLPLGRVDSSSRALRRRACRVARAGTLAGGASSAARTRAPLRRTHARRALLPRETHRLPPHPPLNTRAPLLQRTSSANRTQKDREQWKQMHDRAAASSLLIAKNTAAAAERRRAARVRKDAQLRAEEGRQEAQAGRPPPRIETSAQPVPVAAVPAAPSEMGGAEGGWEIRS